MVDSVEVAATYNDFAQQMSELSHAMAAVGRALSAGLVNGLKVSQEVTRSSYHLLGQYTLPIEDEIFQGPASVPPQSFADFNKIGLAVLFLPVVIPVMLSSITWIPLIGNSMTSCVKSFRNVINLMMFDFPANEKLNFLPVLGVNVNNDPRNALRIIYGIPGDLTGAALALPVASIIAGCRMVSNNVKSFAETWVELVNLALEKKDQLPLSGIIHDDRHAVKKYGIGGIGAGLGFVAGSISALMILAVRGVWSTLNHTLQSFEYAYTNMANLGRARDAQVPVSDSRHQWQQYGIGIIGMTTGAAVGGIAALAILTARGVSAALSLLARGIWATITHTLQSFEYAYTNTANLGRARDAQVPVSDSRHQWQQYGIGIMGIATGAAVGGIAALAILTARGVSAALSLLARGIWATITHTLQSFEYAYTNMANLGRARDAQVPVSDSRHQWQQYGIGIMGIATGAAVGGIAALAIMTARGVSAALSLLARGIWATITHTLQSFEYAYTNMANLGRARDAQVPVSDSRHQWQQYGIGIMGIATGAAVGGIAALAILAARGVSAALSLLARGIWATITHTLQSFEYAYTNTANLGRARDAQVPVSDSRHQWQQYGIGIMGIATGAAVGGIAALTILAARGIWATITNTLQSFEYAYTNIANLGRARAAQVPVSDSRHQWQQYGIGIMGIATGAAVGGIAALAILTARGVSAALSLLARGIWATITHTLQSFEYAYTNIANLGRARDAQVPVSDSRHQWQQYGIGIMGIATGAAVGGIAALAILTARGIWATITHTLQSFEYAYTNTANLGRVRDAQVPVNDSRHQWQQYGIGIIGIATGAAVGGIAALAILTVRGVWAAFRHTALSFNYAYHDMANQGREIDAQLAVSDSRSKLQRYGFGIVGIVTGMAAGSVAALVNLAIGGLSAIMRHTAYSFNYAYMKMANLGRSNAAQRPVYDDRTVLQCYGIGIAGITTGAVGGSIVALATLTIRGVWSVIHHSIQSYLYAYTSIANLGRASEQQVPVHDVRTRSKIFGIGIAGIASGAVVGSIAALVTLAIRGIGVVVTQSALSFKDSLLRTMNLTLPDSMKFVVDDNHRSFTERYLSGAPGVVLGVAMGSVAALSILAARVIWSFGTNSCSSWQALSGSLINGAVNRQWYQGLGGDTRSGIDKSIGVVGYLSAAITSAPVAVGLFTAKLAPLVLGGLAMLSLSPLVATGKLTATCLEACCGVGARFHPSEASDDRMKKFKNLYSSLTAAGNFDLGSSIVKNGNGKESWGLFFVKSLKLNLRSTTEALLDALLRAYRQGGMDSQFFTSTDFDRVVGQIKINYTAGCYDHVDAVTDYDEKIDKLVAFIKGYMAGSDTPVPRNLNIPSHQSSWAATFWGGGRRQAPEGEHDQASPLNREVRSYGALTT